MEGLIPLISVIVPNYNHSVYLEQRIYSILNQTYTNFELILLDDKSTDSSLEILNKFKNHPKVSHCVFNQENSGNTFKQWEKGIKLAKGKYIWIAESDDFCTDDFLEQMISIIQKDKEIVLVYCQSHRVNIENKIIGNWITHTNNLCEITFKSNFIMDGNIFIHDFLIYKNVIPNASAVILRKENIDLKKQIFTNSNFKYCGDWMMYFMLINNNKVAFNKNSLNSFRYHNKSVIASALAKEDSIRIFEIDLKMRKVLFSNISIQNNLELHELKKINRKIENKIKFLMSVLLLEQRKFFKSVYYIMLTSNILYYLEYAQKVFKRTIKKIF
jgi:glycosyltransferase involved in cell wall biosynthesis